MAAPRESLYDVLGVSPGARPIDIARAYEQLVAEFAKDTTPPDPRREARIREAYNVLSDEQRREEYDRLLLAPPPEPAIDRRKAWALGGIAAAIVAAAGYVVFGRGAAPAKPGRPVAEIQADLVPSLGRVESFDISGKATSTGLAFTIASGVMATTCEGLASGAQVVVTIGTRAVPARVSASDEALGLCKLAVDGAGSWPLSAGAEPKPGDRVYAAGVSGAGEVVLAEGRVKRVVTQGQARIVEAGVPVAPAMGGRPLLDVQGRVVAVATATQPGGDARHVTVPPGWADESPAR
jgi:DnaJ domain/Trypsin-like peptidase domain